MGGGIDGIGSDKEVRGLEGGSGGGGEGRREEEASTSILVGIEGSGLGGEDGVDSEGIDSGWGFGGRVVAGVRGG